MVTVAIRELFFRSKVSAAAERLGVAVKLVPLTATLEQAVREAGGGLVLVDLNQPGILEEIRAAKRAAPVRVVGFLGHLQTDLMSEASAAGVDEVLARGELTRRLDGILRAG
jgi:DNA-binding NarL/FixJ family response regulator